MGESIRKSATAESGAGGTEPAPAHRRARPIALYLFVLSLVALVPAFIFSAYLLARNNEAQARVLASLTTGTTQAIASAVERQLEGLEITLRVLETSNALSEESLAAFHARASRALDGTGAYLLVLDSGLEQILNTRVPFGTRLGPTSDPASVERAIESGTQVVSGAFFGRTAGAWTFNVIRPIPLHPSGARVMIMTQNAAALSTALTARQLPPGWNVALVDAGGRVINATSVAGFSTGDAFPLTFDPETARQGAWRTAEIGGVASTATHWVVPAAGWRVVAWAPRSAVEQPLADAFWSLLAGGILLAAVVVLVIYWVSLQIGRSVHGLEDDARLLGAGKAVKPQDYPISEIATVSEALAEASRERRNAEIEVRLLMRELAHRSKNQLTVIAAMAKQSAKSAGSVADFVVGFEKRIHGLGRSTDLLLAHGMVGVDIRDILASQIDPLCPLDSGRVSLAGPALKLNTQSAQIIGMAAHELATNAVKYGAFSVETGRLDITWRLEGESLKLIWRERMAPLAKPSRRRGFGTTVLENMVGRSLGAAVSQHLNPDGIEWAFDIPLEEIRAERESEETG